MSPDSKPREAGWRTRDILRASAIVAGMYVALQLLWFGRTVFLLGSFGVLLGITLSAGVDRLQRHRIPRGVGAVGIVLLVLGGLTGLGLLTAPQISRQLEELRVQQLEGVVVQPLLMKEGLELPPVITILGQALLALVFGFMGLLLAVPLLATAMVPIKMLYVRDVVGDDVSVPGDDAG